MFRYLWICSYFIISNIYADGQTRLVEKLKAEVVSAKTSQQKLQALFALCEERQSLSTDTLCKYATSAKQLSISQNNISNIALAEYYAGYCLIKKGSIDTVDQISEKYISSLKKNKGDVKALMKLTFLRAHVLVRLNKHKDGIAEYYNLLQMAEHNKDTLMQMVAKNGIGWVNMEMHQNREALAWFFKALSTSANNSYHEKASNIYSNTAAVYKQLTKTDSAEYFVKKAIALSTKSQNIFVLANCLNILADIYISSKRSALAEAPLIEALKIRKQIGDPFYVVSDMSQLAIYYANTSEPEKGIAIAKEGIAMAENYNLYAKLPYLYQALGENYKAAGNYTEYSKTLERVMSLKDSIYAATSAEARAEMDIKYNVQKQENIIIQQKLDLISKNYILYASLAFTFFGLIILWLLFKNYNKKQKLIQQSIKEEEKLKALQAVMVAEENERKRISADLHDNLGAYASAISANADDLKISNGTDDNYLVGSIKNNAAEIMMSLRDTIWVLNKNEILLTGVSDRFKNYLKNIRDSYPSVTIEIKENIIDDISLSPQNALNMLRIMQEAFHNAIKHSKGDKITIELSSENGIHVRIIDNGNGILYDENKNGNGLMNMQMRAKANGWKISVTNVKPKGTAVELFADTTY